MRVVIGSWHALAQTAWLDNPNTVFVSTRGWIARGDNVVEIGGDRLRVAMFILAARGGPVYFRDLANALYGDRADGGPVNDNDCVRLYIWHARRRLAPLGIAIDTEHTIGYRARLLPLPAIAEAAE